MRVLKLYSSISPAKIGTRDRFAFNDFCDGVLLLLLLFVPNVNKAIHIATFDSSNINEKNEQIKENVNR